MMLPKKTNLIVTTPTTTQHNLNTTVGLDMKMSLQTPPHPTTQTQHQAVGSPFIDHNIIGQ